MMLRLLFALLCVAALAAPAMANDAAVRGYYRSDGTYVQPHHRTLPGTRQPDFSPRLSPSPSFTPQPFQQPRRY